MKMRRTLTGAMLFGLVWLVSCGDFRASLSTPYNVEFYESATLRLRSLETEVVTAAEDEYVVIRASVVNASNSTIEVPKVRILLLNEDKSVAGGQVTSLDKHILGPLQIGTLRTGVRAHAGGIKYLSLDFIGKGYDAQVRVETVERKEDGRGRSVFVSYSLTNASDKSVAAPYVRIYISDRNGKVLMYKNYSTILELRPGEKVINRVDFHGLAEDAFYAGARVLPLSKAGYGARKEIGDTLTNMDLYPLP